MKGTVTIRNPRCEMYGIETIEGEFSIIEPISGVVELGDILQWNSTLPLGHETVLNMTKGTKVDVVFEDHHVSPSYIKEKLRSFG